MIQLDSAYSIKKINSIAAMTSKDPLLECCRFHQWAPHYLRKEGNTPVDSALVDAEARSALEEGHTELCLDLIKVAKSLGLQSVDQLELKTIALRRLKREADVNIQTDETQSQDLQALIPKLQKTCNKNNWVPQFLNKDFTNSDVFSMEKAILKEAEAARISGNAQFSLNLLDTSIEGGIKSPWFPYLRAKALQALGELDQAIKIWEKLKTYEIDNFSNKVRSELNKANQQILIQKAQQAELSGSPETAVEILASALLDDPNQTAVETALKSLLRKQRQIKTSEETNDPLATHRDDLDVNNAFLLQTERKIENN